MQILFLVQLGFPEVLLELVYHLTQYPLTTDQRRVMLHLEQTGSLNLQSLNLNLQLLFPIQQ